MKLYTEIQMLEAIDRAIFSKPDINSFDILEDLTPIELPSDEEIDAHVEGDFLNAHKVHKYSEEEQLLMKSMCKAGAKWMRDKLKVLKDEE